MIDKIRLILDRAHQEAFLGKRTGVGMKHIIKDNTLFITLSNGVVSHSIEIPLPYKRNGVELIGNNTVRALCSFWMEDTQTKLEYNDIINDILFTTTSLFIPEDMKKKNVCLFRQLINSFRFGNTEIYARRIQGALFCVLEHMPLHETFMNSYIVNKRLVVLDPAFESLRSPEDQLEYQVQKANKYFNLGWTTLGLADHTLSDKNYLLTIDTRTLSPFGIRFHNTQRNLYSTFGMKGDQYPAITSVSEQALIEKGVSRKGWNWFTMFADVPDTFEDQIMVDNIHRNKYICYETKVQIFGVATVKCGQHIVAGEKLGVSKSGAPVYFQKECEDASVIDLAEETVSVGGALEQSFRLVIRYKRYLKDGVKITNRHGNKGVIRMKDLGYATDPVSGRKIKIDVIVGAKTVGKRKNFGQVMEALVANIIEKDDSLINCHKRSKTVRTTTTKVVNGNIARVRSDDRQNTFYMVDDAWCIGKDELQSALKTCGYDSQCTFECNTPYGKIDTVCGRIFWGVIKTPEDDLWTKDKTTRTDSQGIRRSGLKFSHVEFRALNTWFGENSPVIKEILSRAQGIDNVEEKLAVLNCRKGIYPLNKPAINMHLLKPVDQSGGTIVDARLIEKTVADKNFMPEGFMAKLPVKYCVGVDKDDEIVFEGLARNQVPENVVKTYEISHIYVPSSDMRKPWMHGSGKMGLNQLCEKLNALIIFSRKYVETPSDQILNLYLYHIKLFFDWVSSTLCSKLGDISNYAMSVRYPLSSKAVATLDNMIPKNNVEIHSDMAEQLGVKTGDIVLAERFPCMGFVSVRPQKVRVTDDPMCKYTIRVSGNSLVSQNLDFDGDTIYLAAFSSLDSKLQLLSQYENPNKTCYDEIQRLNNRKGKPHTRAYGVDDFNIIPFCDLTCEEHATIVEKNTGVKAQTGPVTALTYDIMRVVENSDIANNHKTKVAIEVFLEKAAQSVFEQKHGGQSLCNVVKDSLCTGDVDKLVEVGFKRGTCTKICDLIKKKATDLGVTDLVAYHGKNKSNIIKRIVREQNKIYFASRSKMEGIKLLKTLSEYAVDIPSKMFKSMLEKAKKISKNARWFFRVPGVFGQRCIT